MTVEQAKELFEGGVHPFFYHPAIGYFLPDLQDKVVLDCGCGKGIYGYIFRSIRNLRGATLVGVDANQYYLDFCTKYKVYDKLIHASVTKIPLPTKSVDLVFGSEVLEHLTLEEGNKFLDEIDRLCRGKAIVTTPNIWMTVPSEKYFDTHHSLWRPRDLKRRGYRVYGLGAKLPFGHRRDWLNQLIFAVYYFLTPIAFKIPQISGLLVAIKDFPKFENSSAATM